MPTVERYSAWIVSENRVFDGRTGNITEPFDTKDEAVQQLMKLEATVTEEQVAIIEEIKAEIASTPPKAKKTRKKKEPGTQLVQVEAPDAMKAQAEAWEQEARERLAELAEFRIDCQEAMDLIGELQRTAFTQRKTIDEQRKFLKEPTLEQGRRIDNMFKPALGCWESVEQACKALIADARRADVEAKAAALAAIQATAGDKTDASALVVAHAARIELPETSTEVVTWEWECFDEGLVPPDFWKRVLDSALIDEYVATHKGDTNVPGLRVKRVVTVKNKAVRS